MGEPIPPTAKVEETPESTTDTNDVETLKTEVEKWRSLARKHENNWQKATTKLSELESANLSEAEKAVELAREDGRRQGRAEAGVSVAHAELKAYAASNGVTLPASVTDFLDATRFVADDGSADMAAIAAFIDPFKTAQPKQPTYPQNIGVGPQGGNQGGPAQLTREELARLTPAEINKARAEGRLNALMLGEP
ncbi:hypothetical protein [Nonomuraea gerenzanensis]|uniref:hypothetical protein n=1 Tax=Nonomuraea gerenzanensis TaxID=93944 RepID=UPI001CD94F3D|nr:hypothetical protein [Nonomuraea gerenzanensis]UBU12909.1 hypothetical protein LCN96_53160 [Nonomuraea gerenzanensis]